jgi:hypothetical protein
MSFPVRKFIHRFVVVNIKMIREGTFLDFYRVFKADPSKEKDQETILRCGSRIMDKTVSGTLAHQTALEQISEVYLRRREFEKAWSGFDTALEIFLEKSPDVTESSNNLSYLTHMLACCCFNLGDRQGTIDVLTQAVQLGVPPKDFEGLLESEKIPELEKLIEQIK